LPDGRYQYKGPRFTARYKITFHDEGA